MTKTDYALYLGEETESLTQEFVFDNHFVLIYSSHQGATHSQSIKHDLEHIKEEIKKHKPEHLAAFEEIIDVVLIKKEKDRIGALACGIIVGTVLYVKTYGEGVVMLRRGDKFGRVVGDGLSASGIITDDDTLVFANKTFLNNIDSKLLHETIQNSQIHEVIETITPYIKQEDDKGSIALFLHIKLNDEEEEDDTSFDNAEEAVVQSPQHEIAPPIISPDLQPIQKQSSTNALTSVTGFIKTAAVRFKEYQQGSSKNKKWTLAAVVVIFIILVWSVGFGINRRATNELRQQIEHSQEVITQKIQEASDVAGLNVERSQSLLAEARTEFESVKKKAGNREIEAIQKIEEQLKGAENSIVKKEDKKAESFYDLKLVNSTARATSMYKDGESALLLNGADKQAYVLNLAKKSVKTYKKDELLGATMGVIYQDDLIFYVPQKGIYKISSDNKATVVIENDPEWGKLTNMVVYNGNLYILDETKADVYKYLVAESGYSAKKSYFKEGQKITLADSATIAIDSALYVATPKKISKFVTGVRDAFSLEFPDSGSHTFDQIVTDKDTNALYVLDKSAGKVYILAKSGSYERQIESSIFKKADAITVLESAKSIFVLVGDKIYSIAL